jgi:hypothetical protein
MGSRAARLFVLPFPGLGHEQPDEENEKRRQRAANHQEPPSGICEQTADDRGRDSGSEQKTFDGCDEAVQADAEQAHRQESQICRGTNQPRDQRA